MLNAPLENRMAEIEDILAEVARLQAENQREISTMLRESRDFKNEMRAFKNEMREFKNEMHEYKEETRQSKKEMDKKWSELAQKMGTMAEDLVAPSVPRVLRQLANCSEEQLEYVAVRAKKRNAKTNQIKEFDVIVVCGDYLLVNETKSALVPSDVDQFVVSIPEVRDYYPHYAGKKVIGALASLYVDESLVRYGEKNGLIVLGTGEELMEILNSPGFKPQEF
ncbi:MAG: hypothetical protein AABZ78_01935 [Chloroflexota bacterium]